MLTGEKVTLRAPGQDDLEALYEIAADLTTWEERTPNTPRPLPRPEFAERFTGSLTHPGDDVRFVVEAGGEPVGRCDLFAIQTLSRSGEVGIALRSGARGKGYGTDALRMLVQFAFERCNLRRVHLTALASNAAGLGCYRKVGFLEEGRQRESAWVRGEYQDEILMGLLRAQWQP